MPAFYAEEGLSVKFVEMLLLEKIDELNMLYRSHSTGHNS